MSDSVVEIDKLTDEAKNKLRDFDELEAYFLLCEIFSNAQTTKDYARFQSDLAEWKKRYPIDLFSDELKRKIKYMLSKEFIETVLKDFAVFEALSKKDPAKGLEKLRDVLDKAEKHKDAKQLDKDLENLYKEYPLNFLKEKYPHVVGQLLSKSNRTRILEKFDSSLAYKELSSIVEHPEKFRDEGEFKSTIEEWQKLYPTQDFNDDFKANVDNKLSNALDAKFLADNFSSITELDLNNGQVINIDPVSTPLVVQDALHDFFKIVDKNAGDINGLFNWTCKYSKYINLLDDDAKGAIVTSLMSKFAYDLPPVGTKYKMPKMDTDANGLLSLSEYNSIDDTKKEVVIQLLGMLSTEQELTPEDRYRLNIINENVTKAKAIKRAKIEPKLELFMEKFPESKLTAYELIHLEPEKNGETEVTIHVDENINDVAESKDDVETEIKPDIKPEEETETEVVPDVKPEEEAETEVTPDVKPEQEFKAEIEPDIKPEEETETEVVPDVKSEEKSEAEVTPDVNPEKEVEIEKVPVLEPEKSHKVEINSEPEHEEDFEGQTAPNNETDIEPDVEPEVAPELQPGKHKGKRNSSKPAVEKGTEFSLERDEMI